MFLVDTSVWIDHLRSGVDALEDALEGGAVLTHPFVLGELACGNLRNRAEVLRLLRDLPESVVSTHAEALAFIERHRLMARGIGYIDVHLLASARLTRDCVLWSRDRRLADVAAELGVAVD